MFSHTTEEHLRQFIHHEALRRSRIVVAAAPRANDPPWWSADKKQQERNRRVYHGLRLLSLQVINHLDRQRRSKKRPTPMPPKRRGGFVFLPGIVSAIYRAGAPSRRALAAGQTSFPVLALSIYAGGCTGMSPVASIAADFGSVGKRWGRILLLAERRRPIWSSAGRGCGMWPRSLACPDGAASASSPARRTWSRMLFCQHPELLHFHARRRCPAHRIWLRVVDWAHRRGGADYRRDGPLGTSPEIPGRLDAGRVSF